MNKKYIIGGLAVIILLAAGIMLWPKTSQERNNKLKVTTSFYPLYFFAQEISGNKADIFNITPSGAEPHDYEPTAKDMANIENSQILILNGGGLETWGNNVQQNIDTNKTLVITAGQNLTTQQVVEDGQNITDPHIWLSPPLAKKIADRIMQGFIQVDPANKEYYQANANILNARLDNLDAEYKSGLVNCTQKNIVTSHAAFGYLASAYNLTQIPISGLSPDAEPSPKQLADITKFVKDNKVQYIFFESLISPKLSNAIATETGAYTLELNPLESLGNQEIKDGQNYVTVMEHNLTNLKIALQCQ